MLINKPGLSSYFRNYPLLKNSKEFDIAFLSIRSIFEDNLSLSSSSSQSSSSSSLNYDFFSSGITFDDFPDTVLNSEEIAFLMFDREKTANQTILKIKKIIENLHSEGMLFGCLIKKIMIITHYIHEDNDALLKELSLNAFAQKVDEYNVYFCLSDAYKMNSQPQIKICLNYIENFSSFKFKLFESNLLVEINNLKIPFDQISTNILNLSKIFDSKIFVSLLPSCLDGELLLENFLKEQGSLIHSLAIHQNIMEVSDSFFEKIIKFCPNLFHLSIKSNILNSSSLKKLHCLRNLVSLNLSWCTNLNLVGNHLPQSLKKINLSHCTKLERIESLPPELLKLNISFCIKLEHLPSSLSKSARVKSLDCWKLNDSYVR